MKSRNKIDVFTEILSLAKNGTRKTTLVFQTKSSFKQMRRYIQILLEKELVKSTNGFIFTSDRGFKFLNNYKELREVHNSIVNEKSLRAFIEN